MRLSTSVLPAKGVEPDVLEKARAKAACCSGNGYCPRAFMLSMVAAVAASMVEAMAASRVEAMAASRLRFAAAAAI